MIMARGRHGRGAGWWAVWLLCCAPLAAAPLLTWSIVSGRTGGTAPIRPSDLLPGMTVEPAASGRGLVVTSLRSGGEAAAKGVAVGDAIAAIDGHRVMTLDEAAACLHNHRGDAIALDIVHDRHIRMIALAGAEG